MVTRMGGGRSAGAGSGGATAAWDGGRCTIRGRGAPRRAWRVPPAVVRRWRRRRLPWDPASATDGRPWRRCAERVRAVRLVGRDRRPLHGLRRVARRRERHHRGHARPARRRAGVVRRRDRPRRRQCQGRRPCARRPRSCASAAAYERLELVDAQLELVELSPGDILLPGNAAAMARFDQRGLDEVGAREARARKRGLRLTWAR